MAQIELTHIEINMLREILVKCLSELKFEIAFSGRKDFVDFLKRRKEFAEGLVERLEKELAPCGKEAISIDRFSMVDFLQGLRETELEVIAPFFEEENVASGVTICEEGARAERLYVLEQGRISICSKKGHQDYVDTPGKIVGWSFLVPPFLYTATAITDAPSKFLVIKSPDFYYFLHKESKLGMKVINNVAQVIAGRLM